MPSCSVPRMLRSASRPGWPTFALLALGVLAVVFGANLITAATRSVDAYKAYDQLVLTLEDFRFTATDQPVIVRIRVGNPTSAPLVIESLDLRLAAGVHTVGGGVLREEHALDGGASTVLTISAAIDDETYVEQLGNTDIEWIIQGRILVRLEHGEPTWIPFGTRYIG